MLMSVSTLFHPHGNQTPQYKLTVLLSPALTIVIYLLQVMHIGMVLTTKRIQTGGAVELPDSNARQTCFPIQQILIWISWK